MSELHELKLQHYRDRVSEYEETIAELRAKFTLATNRIAEMEKSQETEKSDTDEPEKAQMPRRPRG